MLSELCYHHPPWLFEEEVSISWATLVFGHSWFLRVVLRVTCQLLAGCCSCWLAVCRLWLVQTLPLGAELRACLLQDLLHSTRSILIPTATTVTKLLNRRLTISYAFCVECLSIVCHAVQLNNYTVWNARTHSLCSNMTTKTKYSLHPDGIRSRQRLVHQKVDVSVILWASLLFGHSCFLRMDFRLTCQLLVVSCLRGNHYVPQFWF